MERIAKPLGISAIRQRIRYTPPWFPFRLFPVPQSTLRVWLGVTTRVTKVATVA